MKLLTRAFYDREADVVARELLGKYLVCGDKQLKITEAEAYMGTYDKASHGRFGKTPRNFVMFGPAGYTYIYRIYGIHFCLNVVTRGDGAAVLLRGAGEVSGPGNLCRAFGITRELNGVDVTKEGPLYITEGEEIPAEKIKVTPRVGILYAKDWRDKPLRFLI